MSTPVGGVYMDVEWNFGKMARDLTGGAQTAAGAAAPAVTRSFEQHLTAFGAKAAKIGKQWSMYLSAPLVGLGALATKELHGFDTPMARITALAGVNREQVQAWSGDVRRLGVDYGIGGKAAAEALYFVSSSGIKGGQAMDVLEKSSKAAAVGLGEAKTVADLTTSALNAYHGTGLTAAKATDVLVAAVREGKSEPDELAQSMGRVLPVAANLGVSFDQVAGAMASMSTTGTDADEGATQLRGIFNALLKPSQQAEEALNRVGLSSGGLRKELGEQGLLATLKTIVGALGDDSAATAMVFDDVRALTGVMNILGKNTEQTEGIMRSTAGATGDLDKAFDVIKDTPEFKWNQSVAAARDGLIELGATISPIVEFVGHSVQNLTRSFESLPGPVKTIAGSLGLVAVAGGPAVFMFGKLAQAAAPLRAGLQWLSGPSISKGVASIGTTSETAAKKVSGTTSKLSGMARGLGEVGIAVAAVAGAWEFMQQRNTEAVAPLLQSLDQMVSQTANSGDWDKLNRQINTMTDQVLSTRRNASDRNMFNFWDSDYTAQLDAAADGLEKTRGEARKLRDDSESLAKSTGITKGQALQFLASQKALGVTFGSTADAAAAYNKQQAGTGQGAVDAATGVTQLRETVEKVGSSLFGFLDAQNSYKQALKGVTDAQQSYTDAQQKVVDAQRAASDAVRKIDDARRAEADAVRGIAAAERSYEDALRSVTDAERNRVSALKSMEDAQRAVTDAQKTLDEALRGPSEDDSIALERAKLSVQRSKRGLKTATDPLDRKSAALDVRQAERDLERLQAEVDGRADKARTDLTTAQTALDDARLKVEAADRAIIDAHQGVADAARGIADAERQATEAHRAVGDAQRDAADSARAVRDAQRDAKEAADNIGIAQDGAARAAHDLDQKQRDVNEAMRANPAAVGPLLENLQHLKDLYPEVAANVQPYIDKLKELQRYSGDSARINDDAQAVGIHVESYPDVRAELNRRAAMASGAPPGTEFSLEEIERILGIQGRAGGGSVWPDHMYRVAEQGVPELLDVGDHRYMIPSQRGQVIPMDKVATKGRQGRSITNHFNVLDYNEGLLAHKVDRVQGRQLTGRAGP